MNFITSEEVFILERLLPYRCLTGNLEVHGQDNGTYHMVLAISFKAYPCLGEGSENIGTCRYLRSNVLGERVLCRADGLTFCDLFLHFL